MEKISSITAEVGGYEVDMKTWGNEKYLSRIFIKKVGCPQLVFISPIGHSLDYETPTFDYEIKDGILLVSHIVKKPRKVEKRKIICQIRKDPLRITIAILALLKKMQ